MLPGQVDEAGTVGPCEEFAASVVHAQCFWAAMDCPNSRFLEEARSAHCGTTGRR